MVLGSSKCIQGDFRIFFKKVHFYFHILSLLAHFLQDRLELFTPRMSPKWLNLLYGKPWKTGILWKFQFLKTVIVLDIWKISKSVLFFITSWSFCKRILNFWSLKPSQNGTILCSMENSKKIRNFEKISIFEVCSDSRMHKINFWGFETFFKILNFLQFWIF